MKIASDLDSLAAGLHGRRSRMADGERLRSLCSLPSHGALAAALFPGRGAATPGQVQRLLAESFIRETYELAFSLGGARGRYVEWLAARLQVENLKVMVRAFSAGLTPEAARPMLFGMPAGQEAYGPALAKARTPGQLAAALPAGALRSCLERAYAAYPENSRPFFYEAALDQCYFGELQVRLRGLRGADREYTDRLARQETAVFDLMLAARGRFFYGLEKKALLGLFAPGSNITALRFSDMLDAPGVAELRALAAGLAVQAGPPEPDPAALEALAWGRYARLAARAFRGSHMGFGAVAGYLALRRLEAANLITVSEGLRLGVPVGELYSRTLPRAEGAK